MQDEGRPGQPDLERLLEVSDLVEIFKLSRSKISHLVMENGLPGIVKIGASVRFDPEELRAFVKAGGHRGWKK